MLVTMFLSQVLLLLIALNECHSIKRGRPVYIRQVKFLASVRRYPPHRDIGNCTGVLVSNDVILTVASCFHYLFVVKNHVYDDVFHVGAGSSTYAANDIHNRGLRLIFYPGEEDVVLIKVKKPFRIDRNREPAKIAVNFFPNGPVKCEIVGWGRQNVASLAQTIAHKLSVTVVNHNLCARRWVILDDVRPSQVCIKSERGRGACPGEDMGGPIICNGLVIGIMTRWLFGKFIQEPNYAMCGDERQVVMGVKLQSIVPWLKRNIPDIQLVRYSVASGNGAQNIILTVILSYLYFRYII